MSYDISFNLRKWWKDYRIKKGPKGPFLFLLY